MVSAALRLMLESLETAQELFSHSSLRFCVFEQYFWYQGIHNLTRFLQAFCHDSHVLDEVFLNMEVVLSEIKVLTTKALPEPGGSAMLHEWAKNASSIDDALRDPANTPLMHRLCYMHSYVNMMTQICKLNQVGDLILRKDREFQFFYDFKLFHLSLKYRVAWN